MKRKTESEKPDKVFDIVARRCTAFRQKPRALFRAIRNGPAAKGGPRTSAEAEADADAKTEAKAEGRRKKQSKFRTSHKGGDSAGDPPLPIPNREVKPRYADGTAKVGE